ncbi:MAG: MBL fold metallo-hydrolase [Dehalococcoidia bacterium]|nr:MBL fold metallo-hydrolase [Dehalococcoidia bacterium]
MQKVAKNVFAETGIRGCNPGFVVTSDGVVMIDTPQMPTDAIKWRDIIAEHGPVRYLINTEPHGDHWTGNGFFKGTVVAHEGTRQAILAGSLEQTKERFKQSPADYALMKRFQFRPPTITLTSEMTLYVGGHTFKLISLPGHTPYQVAVFIPEEKVIFTSDNVFCKVQPWLQQALPFEWLESLERLQTLNVKVLVPGHGEVCDPTYLPVMSATIKAWINTVQDAMKKGWSLEEAQQRLTPPVKFPSDTEAMDNMIVRMNVARLYQVLGK